MKDEFRLFVFPVVVPAPCGALRAQGDELPAYGLTTDLHAFAAAAGADACIHSHEEDSEAETVFRPATHSFPPSRGRAAFELRPNGTYLESSPGPVDRPEQSSGSWSLEEDRLVLTGEGDRPGNARAIAGAERDRLTLEK